MGILDGNPSGGRMTIIEASQKGSDDDGDGTLRKHDLDKLRKQMREDKDKKSNMDQFRESGRKFIGKTFDYLGEAHESMKTPRTNKRSRIAQLNSFSEKNGIKVTYGSNLDRLKPHNLRGRDIRGKRVSNSNGRDIEIIDY
jgi:hypothetical protein